MRRRQTDRPVDLVKETLAEAGDLNGMPEECVTKLSRASGVKRTFLADGIPP